jgi:TonB family protein
MAIHGYHNQLAASQVLNVAFWLRIILLSLLTVVIGLTCQGQTPSDPVIAPQPVPSSSVKLTPASLALEANRAVAKLKQGIAEHWGDRSRYLSSFEKTPNVDSAGLPVIVAKSYVQCVIERHFRNHQVWDEGVPIDAEARLAVLELLNLEKDANEANGVGWKADGFRPPPCMSLEQRKVVIAAGVAAALLNTKIDPIYPANALKQNVAGTVTLDVMIGTDGHVTTLKVISGPDELRQAALCAVRQWTYQPYQLNGRAVEAETTINVVFNPHR